MIAFPLRRTKPDSGRHYFDRPLGLVLIVGYKIIWGLTEILFGVLLMFSYQLVASELLEDPQDLLANWILGGLHYVSRADTSYFGSIIIAFGLVKIMLGLCLWARVPLVRDIGVVFFLAVALYGLYHLIGHFSWLTLSGLVVDMSALYYFWAILPKHLTKRMVYE